MLAILVGLPGRMAAVAVQWQGRDPRAMEQWVASAGLGSGESVVADFKTYYALRREGVEIYLPTYLNAMSAAERASVHTLLLRQEDFTRATSLLGGQWEPAGTRWSSARPGNQLIAKIFREFHEEDYGLVLYRRIS